MKKEKRQEYSARIVQANRTQLLVIVYEIIQEELEEALRSLEENNIELFDSCLGNAHKFLQELMGTLDYQYEISFSLMSLYKYISKQIISARHSKKKEQLQECSKMIESLCIGYEEVSKQDPSGPLMANAQKVYAGLTYGKGSLSEVTVEDGNGKRGLYA